jgi:hypothetical protein
MRFSEMSNEEVLTSLKSLVGEGNRILADVIAYLAEVEERRIHLELACSSMFDFCLKKLGMSDGEAFRRIAAARLVRRFPGVLDAIASGIVNLSSIVLLRDYFTEDNVEHLLEQAGGKSKREVEQLIARLAPKADVPSLIRKLPERVATPPQTPMPASASTPAPKTQVQPLSESRYKVQLTASASLRDKLEYARGLMSHRNPSGNLAAVVEQALDLLIVKLEKEKLGQTERPRPAKAPNDPAAVSRTVRRQVVERDGFQCSFVGHDGERCASRERLEFDHRTPRALGGTGDAANIRLLCRAHNVYAAEQVFGRTHIEERINVSQRKCGTGATISGARDRVREALRAMGFRSGEAERAILTLDSRGWDDHPIELLLRDALSVIT